MILPLCCSHPVPTEDVHWGGDRSNGIHPVTAQGNGEEARLPLLVVEGTGPNLLGRDWLSRLRLLDWKKILYNPHNNDIILKSKRIIIHAHTHCA